MIVVYVLIRGGKTIDDVRTYAAYADKDRALKEMQIRNETARPGQRFWIEEIPVIR
jgi:hypothetical protein